MILVLNFHGLSLWQKLQKMTNIQKAHAANPTLVPGLNPDPADVDTKLTDAKKLFDVRAELIDKLKANTKLMYEAETDLENTFVSLWAPQTQAAIGMDQDKAKLLGYDIKGEKEVIPPSPDSVPLIADIDISVHGQHTLLIHNNLTKKVKLPDGILRIDIYGLTGGTAPIDLADLIAKGGGYLGQATRGKFVNTFGSSNMGQPEHYIAVYVDKATKKPFSQGIVVSALIS